MATIRKRTSTKADDSKVVSFVIETRSAGAKKLAHRAVNGRMLEAKKPAPKAMAKKAASAKAVQKREATPQVVTYTALKTSQQSNPFLVGRQKAVEIAKRTGILDEAGHLAPFFK